MPVPDESRGSNGGAPATEPVDSAQAGAGSGVISAKRPPLGVAGDSGNGGTPSGGAPSDSAGEPNGGEPGAAGAGTEPAGPQPSCGKQADGTLCGANMTPAGSDGTRYFCNDGEVLAEARCPGACDVETNACVQSGGTGDGSGETNLRVALRCPACYELACRDELDACRSDALCRAHLGCVESCSLQSQCFSTCDSVFADEPILPALDKCTRTTGCLAECPPEEP
ncbi:MAG TPA: hypothetical protein VEQ59_08020 [Polyangiaceae bacterium]|nr:hypothetical protein [Polyangiaceae bacterium]